MLRVSFWDWVDVEVVVVATGVVVVAVVIVGGRSRGAGTGCTGVAAGMGTRTGTRTGTGSGTGSGRVLWARLHVRMLQRLSEELLRPDWLLASLPRSCWSTSTSWADSVLLCTVTEMRGLDAVRGGTGGGAFLLPTTDKTGKETKKRAQDEKHAPCLLTLLSPSHLLTHVTLGVNLTPAIKTCRKLLELILFPKFKCEVLYVCGLPK